MEDETRQVERIFKTKPESKCHGRMREQVCVEGVGVIKRQSCENEHESTW